MDLHPAALGAVARSRALGMHFWGHFVGVTPLSVDPSHTRMRLVPESTVLGREGRRDQPVEVTSLMTLADLCMGFAIRAQGPATQRLATTSLTYQQMSSPRGAVTCHTEVIWASTGGSPRSLVQAHLTDNTGKPVAEAQAWFLMMPIPDGAALTPMPWERTATAVPRLRATDLTEHELAAATEATLASQSATSNGTPAVRELLGLGWSESTPDRVVGTAEIGPHLSNRIGDVQGGALFGIAATAAARLVEPDLLLADAGMQYLRAARGKRIIVTATSMRQGRTAHFVEARIEVDSVLTNVAHLTFLRDQAAAKEAPSGSPQGLEAAG